MKLKNLLFVAMVISIASCQSSDPFGSDDLVAFTSSSINYSSITYRDGLLVFDSYSDVLQTMADLESDYDVYDSIFLATYDTTGYSDEEYSDLEDSVGHNDNAPYEVFEGSFPGYRSLRAQIDSQENAWLAGIDSSADFSTVTGDPDDHFIEATDEFRAVLNTDAEIATLDTVYRFYEDYFIKIFGAGIDTLIAGLDSVRQNSWDIASLQTDTVYTLPITGGTGKLMKTHTSTHTSTSSPPTCIVKTGKKDKGRQKSGDEKRSIKFKLWVNNLPFVGNAVTKTKNFRKRKVVGWKKFRATCQATGEGNFTDPDNCQDFPFTLDTGVQHRKRKVRDHCCTGESKVKSGAVTGTHTGAGGITKNTTITF